MTATRKPPLSTVVTTSTILQNQLTNNQQSQVTPNVTVSEEVMAEEQVKETGVVPSFKEALLTALGEEGLKNACWDDLINEDYPENKWYKEEAGPPIAKSSCPKVPFTTEELDDWAKPWKNTLIVKVMGKRVNFRMLENKLRREWVRYGTIRITDMAEDYYMVQLSDIEDYRHALYEGPWKVADHYLIVQRWRPYFSYNASITQKVAVWIRIPKLPMELCNEKYLTRVGSALGTMMKIDKLTSLHSRGKYARICVELDLEQPLASHIDANGMKFAIEYEGLHSICFRCGKYGHKKDSCQELLEVEKDRPTASKMVNQLENSPSESMQTETMNNQPLQETQNTEREVEQVELEMGSWNIPKYITKKKKYIASKNTKKGGKDTATAASEIKVSKKTVVESMEEVKASDVNKIDSMEVNTDDPKLQEPTVTPAVKNIIKERVRNPLAGKNSQLSVKGKKVTKNSRQVNKKDKGNGKGSTSNGAMVCDAQEIKNTDLGKENIPSSSMNTEASKAEEEAMLAYMRSIFQSTGQNLLSKFKSMEPIRTALRQIDNSGTTENMNNIQIPGTEVSTSRGDNQTHDPEGNRMQENRSSLGVPSQLTNCGSGDSPKPTPSPSK